MKEEERKQCQILKGEGELRLDVTYEGRAWVAPTRERAHSERVKKFILR